MGQPIKVTTTGSAGSATGSGTGMGHGVVHGVVVKFHASAPATTDVAIKRTINGVDEAILTLTNVNTSAVYHPPGPQHAIAGGAAIASSYSPFVLDGELLTVSVTGCDALTDAVEVSFLLLP